MVKNKAIYDVGNQSGSPPCRSPHAFEIGPYGRWLPSGQSCPQ
jgi:hypothetical protein